jgi:Helix-turn-helix domain
MTGLFTPNKAYVAGLTPQASKVLAIMEAQGSISTREAVGYRIGSVSRRITEIKDAFVAEGSPYFVLRELRVDAEGQRYARYHLRKKKAA